MAHKFKKETFEAQKEAKDVLQVPAEAPKNVPELRERVFQLEKVVGVVATVEE